MRAHEPLNVEFVQFRLGICDEFGRVRWIVRPLHAGDGDVLEQQVGAFDHRNLAGDEPDDHCPAAPREGANARIEHIAAYGIQKYVDTFTAGGSMYLFAKGLGKVGCGQVNYLVGSRLAHRFRLDLRGDARENFRPEPFGDLEWQPCQHPRQLH